MEKINSNSTESRNNNKKNEMSAIAAFNAVAREHNMTYGKYEAKLFAQKIFGMRNKNA